MSIFGFHVDWWIIALSFVYVAVIALEDRFVYMVRIINGFSREGAQKSADYTLTRSLGIDIVVLAVLGYFAYHGEHPYLLVGYVIVTILFKILGIWALNTYLNESKVKDDE